MSTQAPATQWPDPQARHASPPLPQARVSVPARQVDPAQQPDGQLVALQSGLTQAPPLQAEVPQSRQAAPPVPQAAALAPVTQWPA